MRDLRTYDFAMRTLTRPLVATSLAATVLLTACGAPRDEADAASDTLHVGGDQRGRVVRQGLARDAAPTAC